MTHLTRREWIQTATMLMAGSAVPGCPPPRPHDPHDPNPPDPPPDDVVPDRPIRKNIATLADTDPILLAFQAGVAAMKALPTSDPRNWQRQAQIHQDFCPHGNWLFLPWHRAYLHYFERIIRKLSGDPSFALPYWHWGKSPQIPAAFWGGTTSPLWHPRDALPASTADGDFIGKCVLCEILDEPNFLLFGSGSIPLAGSQRANGGYGPLEARPHNYVHGFVGGDMGSFMSPLDPVFWCHHNMIELCWYDWNLLRGNANTNDAAWTQRSFNEFFDEDGNGVQISVQDMLTFPLVQYQYDAPVYDDCHTCPTVTRPITARRLTTSAEGKQASAELNAGRPVQFNAQPFGQMSVQGLRLNQPRSLQMAAPQQTLTALKERKARVLLRLSGVEDRPAGEVLVRVFVNKPDASPDTPTSDPHFVTTFAFFGHGHHTRVFNIDATEAIRRVAGAGTDVTVQLISVPFPGRKVAPEQLQVDRLELLSVSDQP